MLSLYQTVGRTRFVECGQFADKARYLLLKNYLKYELSNIDSYFTLRNIDYFLIQLYTSMYLKLTRDFSFDQIYVSKLT